jgi:hypothetical protein
MTTRSDTAQIAPYWFGRPEQEIRAAVAARDEAWASVPGYSRYEWSDKGRLRRVRDGYVMKTTKLNNSGYVIPNVIRDSDGKQVTVALAPMVLLAHHPAFCGLDKFPDGLETRHNPAVGDKTFNAYPEGIWPGTRAENDAERVAVLAAEGRAPNGRGMAAPKPPPAPCIRCGGPVTRGGRRCHECVVAIGVEATSLMRAGVKLEDANEQLDYANAVYLHNLAVKYGGWGHCPACSCATDDPPVAVTLRNRIARAVRPRRRRDGA